MAATTSEAARLAPTPYPHVAGRFDVVETHISWVLLAGSDAYKIKKPVKLHFLDFSTLEKRRFFCEEEVRLNRRTAPGLYLGVVPIAGNPPMIGGRGKPVDYAVHMRRFPADMLFTRLARDGLLTAAHVDALAGAVARFHAAAVRAAPMEDARAVDRAVGPAFENFADIDALETAVAVRTALLDLGGWTRAEAYALASTLARRHIAGFVRDCHGDLHLGNVALVEGAPVPFDCIEFNPALRTIDVMSDVAFMTADLAYHGLPRLAARFLGGYLEATGDYAGLRVLRFYLVYRAMVRAKIACIRKHQASIGEAEYAAAQADFVAHLRLARRLARPGVRALFLMHGVSGSGKTYCSQELVEALGAVRLRSDVERKRLHGLEAAARTHSPPGGGLYTNEASDRTYEGLAALAADVLASGFPVIVDAASLARRHRDLLRGTARAAGAAFEIVSCVASPEVLAARVATRGGDASEADAAVLALQRATEEPLGDDERLHCTVFDTGRSAEWRRTAAAFARRFHPSLE